MSVNSSRRSILVYSALLTALAACTPPPEFRSALSEPGQAVYDKRLIGHWYFKSGTDLGDFKFVIVPTNKDDTSAMMVSAMTQSSKMVLRLTFRAYASKIEGTTYYNVLRVPSPGTVNYTASGEAPGYIIARTIFLNDDGLLICLLTPRTGPPPTLEPTYRRWLKGSDLTAPVKPARSFNRYFPYHILVEGSREKLIDLVLDGHPRFFRGFLLFRARTPVRLPKKHPKLTTAVRAAGYQCRTRM